MGAEKQEDRQSSVLNGLKSEDLNKLEALSMESRGWVQMST